MTVKFAINGSLIKSYLERTISYSFSKLQQLIVPTIISYVPTKFSYISSKISLYNTDPLQNGQRTLSAGPSSKFISPNLTSLLRTLRRPAEAHFSKLPVITSSRTSLIRKPKGQSDKCPYWRWRNGHYDDVIASLHCPFSLFS